MSARWFSLLMATGLCLSGAVLPAVAAQSTASTKPAVTDVHVDAQGVAFHLGNEQVSIRLDGAGVVHVKALPASATTDKPTLVIAPHRSPTRVAGARVYNKGGAVTLASHRLVAVWHQRAGTLDLMNAQHQQLLQLDLTALATGHVQLKHASGEAFYGIGGYSIHQSVAPGLLRHGKLVAKAGKQGHSGAPFVWSTAGYGVLVDSDGAVFGIKPQSIEVSGLSKLAVDVYLMVGKPPQLFAELARLSGHAPMFPKWSLGFMASQWGLDQKKLLHIVDTYRSKHIPIDGYILDFDWKAWGQPWGEFRWNFKKFPGARSGKLQTHLGQMGIHLGGIMKPRLLVDTPEGRYATAHDLWMPHSMVFLGYFAHQPVKILDFDKPATRHWFGQTAIKYAFDKGIRGWWNDEADVTDSNTEFLNMERALYTAQRAQSKLRVWSLNRDFWLGAQRYAYGMWSGDIDTGFKTMAKQRTRMLSAIDDGEMWWGMDGGGFNGHPSDENYARWIEFDAFAPIFRTHGSLNNQRQPWHFGPVAEKAATHAIRLRYQLLPYIYSYAWHDHVTGVGLVRPLTFGWPGDPKVRNDVDAWMFGKWLLVSPVVKQGQTHKHIYLPAGTWTNWFTGKRYHGGQSVTLAINNKTWMDIPLFIRQGAIIPTQPVLQYVDQHPITQVSVDVFPSKHATHFDYYADDGDTYAYTHGAYYLQRLGTQRDAQGVQFTLAAPKGSYQPALRYYLLKIHGIAATVVRGGGHHAASLDALKKANGAGWADGHDRYGPVTWVRVDARQAQTLHLQAAGAD